MSTAQLPDAGPSLPNTPPEAWDPLLRLVRNVGAPLERFLRLEAASGLLLLLAAAAAIVWANSPWAESYAGLWHTPLGVRVGGFAFERTLEWLVNDVLMVIFFFLVGLEIRRELHDGELCEWRRAALPTAAALGGMIAPAALYLLLAGAPETRAGWGIPMATDIAFALGVLTLLGPRVPAALRVLLLALAVIDDLGAIAVIALFYGSGLEPSGFLVAALGLGGVFLWQRLGVRAKLAYVIPGAAVWAGVSAAGVHPSIAGVVIGLATPVRAWFGPDGFVVGVRVELERLARAGAPPSHELAASLRHVELARREARSPAEGLIERLHPWVAFGIMPLFALANAGVSTSGGGLEGGSWVVATSVAAALLVGKALGVVLASWLVLRLGLGALPPGVTSRQLVVLGAVAGVGFTMSLFMAQLAFGDARLLAAAKLGVLAGSASAAALALVLGRLLLAPTAE